MFIKFSAIAQGKSHIEKNILCQDAVDAKLDSYSGMACVADGHGGSKYSRSQKGASFAVTVAMRSLSDYRGTIARQEVAFFNKKVKSDELKSQEIKDSMKQLERSIIYQWRNDVLDDLSKYPLTDEEIEICKSEGIKYDDLENLIILYGTTLLAALVSDSFWFILQIGDGLCVVLENDGPKLPIPEDKRLAFGRTTSMCDTDAIDNFREFFGCNSIKGITVATDGVTDSFEPEGYLQFSQELYDKFMHVQGDVAMDLQEFLPELSKRGSGDDVAIAGIFRKEEI
jgi:hypothetical protein